MSIARHHAEWLSLLEISGPFLSMPVLLNVFPQGLDAVDPALAQTLRAAYEEWADNQGGLSPERAIHQAWLRFVLGQILAFPDVALAEGQAIPESIRATLAEHGETIRPDLMVVDPDNRQPLLIVHTYPPQQDLDKVVPGRNWKASPAARMTELLRSTAVPLGLVTNGEQWLLVAAKAGETTGYVSWYAGLWLEERLTLRAFRSLLGVGRFFGVPDDQTLPALLAASAKDQHELTDQLGYQVRRAVEILVQAVDRADQDRGRSLLIGVDEKQLYEAALTVMMRLVFMLTAEERDLLLLGDPIYDQYYAISTLRAQLRTQADQHGEEVLERGFDAWCRLLATFRAVFGGVQHENLTLPAYGGSLFDPDRFPFLEGRMNLMPRRGDAEENKLLRASAPPRLKQSDHWREDAADPLPINNRTVLHLLEALQILQVKVPGGGGAEARRMSFRALDIEQIGHVYEGLLDHEARRAAEPVLGLAGTQNKEPEVALAQLEAFLLQRDKGGKAQREAESPGVLAAHEKLLDFLQEQTGRSRSALQNALNQSAIHNPQSAIALRIACGNDEALYRRVRPFAGVIRNDDYGWPVVIVAGSVYVTAGTTRRATGTHYTPRSLTEPIVQHTLEPLVYDGPTEGKAREDWRLRSAKELLDLKVCDMAMGSGAFLVQASRYLSERLVEAWAEASQQSTVNSEQVTIGVEQPINRQLSITPEGQPATGSPGETIIPDDDEERLVLARRLVAERCLYGVDKNPLAVEMAKLSLWLVTLSKNKAFTFLNHALRHGDSLIGVDEEGYNRWWHSLKGTVGPLYAEENEKALHEARRLRRELQAMQVLDVQDAQRKADLLAAAEAATAKIRRACDLLVGIQLLGLSNTEQEAWRQKLLIEHTGSQAMGSPEARQALAAARQHDAFHWFVEFPEVFAQGGFSAFIGNPPFIGGKKIRETLGEDYRLILYEFYPAAGGNADYCALFFLRSYLNLGKDCSLGLIATNTIAQGDTREAGLDLIVKNGGTIYNATNNLNWPGTAAITVNVVHIFKGSMKPPFILDNKPESFISSLLDARKLIGSPLSLNANSGLSFIGVYPRGNGFVLDQDEGNFLLEADARNREVIHPYLIGQDLNDNPTQTPSRWIINFSNHSLEQAKSYPQVMDIVMQRVYPERMGDEKNRAVYEKFWWRYWRTRNELFKTIEPLTRVITSAQTSKYLSISMYETGVVFDQTVVVIALNSFSSFAVLTSSFHEVWVRAYSATMRNAGIRYTPSDCFQNFPFPAKDVNKSGRSFHKYRQDTMLNRQEGLTATYNRFHDPAETAEDIAHLRRLHVEMDNAVAAAYGWHTSTGSAPALDLGHGFHETAQGLRYTISEAARREVLTRLLQLNHQRYAEEQAQAEEELTQRGKGAKGAKKPKKNDGQLSLL